MKMIKKLSIVMALLLAFAGTSKAGDFMRFGIKAGMNINKISFSKDNYFGLAKPGNSCGWEAGVMAQFKIPLVGLGADVSLMYARMNNSSNVDAMGQTVLDGDNFGKNFLQIPINLKYMISLPIAGNFLSPYIFTGPEFAFNLDKEVVSNIFKAQKCQVAWNIGLGLQFVNHLQIGASYGFGINNIAKKIVDVETIKAKNNYWTITAAYLF